MQANWQQSKSTKHFLLVLCLCAVMAFSPSEAYSKPTSLKKHLTSAVCMLALIAGFGSLGLYVLKDRIYPNHARAKQELRFGKPELSFQVDYAVISSDALRHGYIHAGRGVVLDIDRVENVWTAEERRLLEAPRTKQNQIALLRMFVSRIYTDKRIFSVEAPPDDYAQARFVSSCLKGELFGRREKLISLVALARYYRIEANIHATKGKHVDVRRFWAVFPELSMTADSSADPVLFFH